MDNVLETRREKDEFFRTSPYSPLLPAQQARFTSLSYFDPDPALVFELAAEPFPDQAHVKMQTSTGEVRSYLRWGRVRFQLGGQQAELVLYLTPGQPAFFIPFTDATTGHETYSAGRYLEAAPQRGSQIRLDFNLAYNPYCAYNPPESLIASEEEAARWSCPIPPRENHLELAIRAGEKKPAGDWVAEEHE